MSLNKVSSQLKPVTFTVVPLIHTFLYSLRFFYDKKEAKRMNDNGELYNKSKGEFGNVSDCAQYYFLIQITKELIDQQIDLIDLPGILIFEEDKQFSVVKESDERKLIQDKTQWVWEYLNEKYPYKNTIRNRWNPIFKIETKKISPNYCLNVEYFINYIAYLKRQANLLYSLPQYLDEVHQQEKFTLFKRWDSYLIMLDNKDYSLVDDRSNFNNFKVELITPDIETQAKLEALVEKYQLLITRNQELEAKQNQIDAIPEWRETIRTELRKEMQKEMGAKIEAFKFKCEAEVAELNNKQQIELKNREQEYEKKLYLKEQEIRSKIILENATIVKSFEDSFKQKYDRLEKIEVKYNTLVKELEVIIDTKNIEILSLEKANQNLKVQLEMRTSGIKEQAISQSEDRAMRPSRAIRPNRTTKSDVGSKSSAENNADIKSEYLTDPYSTSHTKIDKDKLENTIHPTVTNKESIPITDIKKGLDSPTNRYESSSDTLNLLSNYNVKSF